MTNGIIEIHGDVCQLAIPYFIWVLLPFQYFPSLANLTQNEPPETKIDRLYKTGREYYQYLIPRTSITLI